ncbi:MAG: DUF5683 domain-containing protein [Paludibacter sp.]
MYVNRKIFFLLLFLISFVVQAQVVENKQLPPDTLKNKRVEKVVKQAIQAVDTTKFKPFRPDPGKVVWMAAIIPGFGQIMNHKYWKLPIVYGGFLGCAYAVSWNSTMYQTYLNAYRDIVDTDPATNSYLLLIPKGRTIDSYGGTEAFKSILNTKQESYRRYRDLSVILTVGYYAITIIDAFVDAQLYDFDISPDLSLRVQPALFKPEVGSPNALGLQCSINLK